MFLNGKAEKKYKTDARCMAAIGTLYVTNGS